MFDVISIAILASLLYCVVIVFENGDRFTQNNKGSDDS